MTTPDIKIKVDSKDNTKTVHNIMQWVIWGDNEHFKDKFNINTEKQNGRETN